MGHRAVLHVTSLLGGGVDRHVRDIARATSRPHLVWHVGDRAEVMEIPGEHIVPLDPARVDAEPDAMASWLAAKDVGVIHVHTLSARARERADHVRRELGVELVVTLHDILFLRAGAFEESAPRDPDPVQLEENARFLRSARAVIAPSEFIAGLARRHIEGLAVEVIPNGADPPRSGRTLASRPEFAEHRPQHVAAVLGAIGPHKGADILDALAHELKDSGIGMVVIGYLDRQVIPGWRVPGTLFVHGAYQDDEVPALLAAYGARLALFPNRVPESFSYALSDLWSCGLPVLASPEGALGERIARHGGGWLLPGKFDAAAIARRLREIFSSDGAAERARVESQLLRHDPERVPPLAAMARSLDALYERFGIDARAPGEADAAAIEKLIAANLDGSLFRAELARLADEYAQLLRTHEDTVENARKNENDSREWIAKLERDIAALTADVEREVGERRSLGEVNAQLAIHKAAFDKLPEIVRKWYLKKVLDARS
jgi:glycosyltransferase involved in cell wall biosynthesis